MPVKSDDSARATARARFAHLADAPGHPDDGVQVEASTIDLDNPPLTDDDLARMRPAEEVHPDLVAAKRKGGRPRAVSPKVAVSLRLDADVLEALRASGEGWQGRANAALRKAVGLA